MNQFERYWVFALGCALVAIWMTRLILRERITLQGSLSFLLFLGAMAAVALFPGLTGWIATRTGFTLPSNFFFSISIGGLALLHISTLTALSRVELRSIALTQELGLLQEKLERALREGTAGERKVL
jgi:hypothetical protein